MKTSESINEIAHALSVAQGEMVGATKGSKNHFFKSNYSDMASVMQAISKPFFNNELSFVQGAEYKDGMICIVTRIMHPSGQWIESETMLPPVKNDPQAYGSAITYGKRYGLQALAGVPSVDDDGQFASASAQQHDDEVTSTTLTAMIELIDANDVAYTQLWHEQDRVEQEKYWTMLNTKQKKVARELLNMVSSEKQ